jgi:hypothetical protein
MVVTPVLLSVGLACSPTQALGFGFAHLFPAAVVQAVEDVAAVVQFLAAAAAAPRRRDRLASRVRVDLNVTTSPRHRSRASSVFPILPSVGYGRRHEGDRLPSATGLSPCSSYQEASISWEPAAALGAALKLGVWGLA